MTTEPCLPNSERDLGRAREHYAARGWVKLEGFFAPALLQDVERGIAASVFETKDHGKVGVELCLQPCALTERLMHLVNAPAVRRCVEDLTDAGRLGCFEGRIYRLVANAGHQDDWHTDMIMGRMVAMSVNLSAAPYEGGVLRIRRAGTHQLLEEVPNVGAGDAVLFRLSHELEHRVTEVTGAIPKTAYAGWFRARPEFEDVLAGRANL
jgi:hypothetical protein